jgi:hypothetical protein
MRLFLVNLELVDELSGALISTIRAQRKAFPE